MTVSNNLFKLLKSASICCESGTATYHGAVKATGEAVEATDGYMLFRYEFLNAYDLPERFYESSDIRQTKVGKLYELAECPFPPRYPDTKTFLAGVLNHAQVIDADFLVSPDLLYRFSRVLKSMGFSGVRVRYCRTVQSGFSFLYAEHDNHGTPNTPQPGTLQLLCYCQRIEVR